MSVDKLLDFLTNRYFSFVQTDMGYFGAKTFGMEKPPTTVEECVKGMVSTVSDDFSNYLESDS